MSIFGNNSSATNEVSPNTFQTPAAGVGKPKTTVSSKGRTINENVERSAPNTTSVLISASPALEKKVRDVMQNAQSMMFTGKDGFLNAMDKAAKNFHRFDEMLLLANRYGTKSDRESATNMYVKFKQGNRTFARASEELSTKLSKKFDAENNAGGDGFQNVKLPKWSQAIPNYGL
jgi:hypothetical protein